MITRNVILDGPRIESAQIKAGMTAREFAAKLGIGVVSLNRVLRGAPVSIVVARRISKKAGIPFERLLRRPVLLSERVSATPAKAG